MLVPVCKLCTILLYFSKVLYWKILKCFLYSSVILRIICVQSMIKYIAKYGTIQPIVSWVPRLILLDHEQLGLYECFPQNGTCLYVGDFPACNSLFLLHRKVENYLSLLVLSCYNHTISHPMDHALPGSSVQGILF